MREEWRGRLREIVRHFQEHSTTPAIRTLILGSADGLTPSTRKGSDYAKRAAAAASPSR